MTCESSDLVFLCDDAVVLTFGPIQIDSLIDLEELVSDLLPQYQTLIDEAAGGVTYYGFSMPDTATSAAAWRIFRTEEGSDPEFVKKYANGETGFTQVWDDRASLPYS